MTSFLLRQRIISGLFSQVPTEILSRITSTKLIIPYYHMVSNEEKLHIKYLYEYKNIKQFKDDVEFLLREYFPISLFSLLDSIEGGRALLKKSFLLTFDDGFREMHDIVAPILFEKGIPAIFFINSGFIDNQEMCYEHKASIIIEQLKVEKSRFLMSEVKEILRLNGIGITDTFTGLLSAGYRRRAVLDQIARKVGLDFKGYLAEQKPFLSSYQITKLLKNGFAVGGHSIDHPVYSALTLEEQLCQTMESVKVIREMFCLDYGLFAFPYSDENISKEYFVKLFRGGIVNICFGTSGIIDDSFPNIIQRFSLERTLMPAKRIIAYQYAKKIGKILRGSDKIVRR